MYDSDWFSELFGFPEGRNARRRQENIQTKLVFDDLSKTLYSHANGRTFTVGKLETPSVVELQASADGTIQYGEGTVDIINSDVSDLHRNELSSGATFQAASQFNLLEMVSPHTRPSDGISKYASDHTQGPMCAIECAAGTVYRNYYVQDDTNQIDCIRGVRESLGSDKLWDMINGYCMITDDGVAFMDDNIGLLANSNIFDNLKVGVQYNTEVVHSANRHCVTQVYCSAIPIAYMRNVRNSPGVRMFAKSILKKTYEASVYAAVINAESTGNRDLYLTFVGGGAFGNNDDDIVSVILDTIALSKNYGINIKVVCYGKSRYDQMASLI